MNQFERPLGTREHPERPTVFGVRVDFIDLLGARRARMMKFDSDPNFA
jgi:hypothetical protein